MTARVLDPAKLTKCPDCGGQSFGSSHDGNCTLAPIQAKVSAAQLIRWYATTHDKFSGDDIRPLFDSAGITEKSRGPAMGKAVKDGVLRKVGHVRSTNPATKGHEIGLYTSLIYRWS